MGRRAVLGDRVIVTAGDVVRFDGTTDTIEFDTSVEGIPDGVIADAVTVHSSSDLMLSFDTAVDLTGRPSRCYRTLAAEGWPTHRSPFRR